MSVLVKTLGDPKRVMPVIQGVAEGAFDRELYPTLTPLTAGFRKECSAGGDDRLDSEFAGRGCGV